MEIKETQPSKTVFYVIIFILIMIIISMYTCKGNTETVLVDVPATSGTTPIAKPSQEPLVITKDSLIFKFIPITTQKEYDYWKSEAERIESEKSEKIQAFKNANDSLKQLLYTQANTQNEFLNEWDNDTINLKVYGFNTGEIHSMQAKYNVKKRKQELKVPQMDFRLLAGGEVGVNKELNQGTWKVNVSVQDKSNNLWSGSFQRIGNQDYYLAGFQKSIFTSKK